MSDQLAEAPWIALLREECKRTSGVLAGRRIGYSSAVVSGVLNGTYKGDLSRVQSAVEGALGGAEVECPVIGPIPRERCVEYQRMPFKATNPLAVQMHRACPDCPNGGKRS